MNRDVTNHLFLKLNPMTLTLYTRNKNSPTAHYLHFNLNAIGVFWSCFTYFMHIWSIFHIEVLIYTISSTTYTGRRFHDLRTLWEGREFNSVILMVCKIKPTKSSRMEFFLCFFNSVSYNVSIDPANLLMSKNIRSIHWTEKSKYLNENKTNTRCPVSKFPLWMF